MKTRKEIETFLSKAEKQHDKDMNFAWHTLLDEYPYFATFKARLFGVRFIDFLSGDDQRDRWECHECQKGCAILVGNERAFGISSEGRPYPSCGWSNWKKVGGE